MAKFQILSGKALSAAIKGRAAQVATFKEREHQIAVSCLHHVEQHSDVIHLNALLAVTPANYRRGLVLWAGAYGKVSYDKETRAFAFSKGKKSDLTAAEAIAPADYEKVKADKEKPAKAFDVAAYLLKVIAKLEEEGADPRILSNIAGAHKIASGKVPAAKVKAEPGNVDEEPAALAA